MKIIRVCPKCDYRADGNVSFCIKCGMRMVDKEIENIVKSKKNIINQESQNIQNAKEEKNVQERQSVQTGQAVQADQEKQNQQRIANETKHIQDVKGSNNIWKGVSAFGGIIIVVLIGFMVMFEKKDVKKQDNDHAYVEREEDKAGLEEYNEDLEENTKNDSKKSNLRENEITPSEYIIQSAEPIVSEYMLPDSNSRYLTRADLQGFTAEQCRIARNELFARHGRKFLDDTLQAYFNSKSWYIGTIEPDAFNDAVFNEFEIANRDLIVQFEKEQGYR